MRRARLLHVLASAPAAVLLTVAPALSSPAVGAATIPPPYVVCIDPGHGGNDPGAIGLDGLVEKNLTLDISDRLAALLRADGVTVVLTRTTDASVSITQRAEIANASHADVFLPIYFNAWTTPTPDGSVVLYPYARDIPFADAISQAVTNYIKPYGDDDGGIVLRPDWWLTPTMPVATVESLFITNPHDAALLTQGSFRQGLAEALKKGIEAYLPGIQQRLASVPAATPAKLRPASGPLGVPPSSRASTDTGGPARAVAPAAPAATGGGPPAALQVLGWLLLLAAMLLAIRHRRRLLDLAGTGLTRAGLSFRGSGIHHRMLRRRRRLTRRQATGVRPGDGGPAPPAYELFSMGLGPWGRPEQTAGGAPFDAPPPPGVEVRGRPVSPARTAAQPARGAPLDDLPL
jgi:N-acetylmuramoyl-L-alanine amidase